MNIDALQSALVSLTLLPEELRSARENLRVADSAASAGCAAFLESIERDLRIAKAALARELGYSVCNCCWPPEFLVEDGAGQARCPNLVSRESATLAAMDDWSPGDSMSRSGSGDAEACPSWGRC